MRDFNPIRNLVIAAAGASPAQAPVSSAGVIYTTDDLFALGFKQVKAYSVEGLPGASAAIFGFWRPPDNDPLDYEVRFYASHDEAVRLGPDLAEEGTGEDAILGEREARYKEGVKDRRTRTGYADGIVPKYRNYAIVDNVVMLCQGRSASQSLERCSYLAGALAEAVGS
ncbi:MAG: hypothetical protein IH867_07400 [Chloroflexi bacterium]|nr:hypothetical protein [Chloroflexota bacterium]